MGMAFDNVGVHLAVEQDRDQKIWSMAWEFAMPFLGGKRRQA